jgi:hypothetical protein
MAGAIHFVPWSKPTRVGQFWLFHTSKFPTGQTFLAAMSIFKLSPNRFEPQFDNGCAEA